MKKIASTRSNITPIWQLIIFAFSPKDELAFQVERVRANAKEMASSKAETERSHTMLRDRLRQIEDDLDKTKIQMEKALKERALLDNKLSQVMTENVTIQKKLTVQERALTR